MSKPHVLSDGTTLTVKTTRTLIGVEFREAPSRKRKTSGAILWSDGPMYLLTANGGMVRISHPDYSYADDAKLAERKALAFYVDSAESVIRHAAEEGISVESCY